MISITIISIILNFNVAIGNIADTIVNAFDIICLDPFCIIDKPSKQQTIDEIYCHVTRYRSCSIKLRQIIHVNSSIILDELCKWILSDLFLMLILSFEN